MPGFGNTNAQLGHLTGVPRGTLLETFITELQFGQPNLIGMAAP